MNNQQLLTIAIPTFNRADFLDLCLQRLSEELVTLSEDNKKLINIFISDNNSTDHTSEITAKYKKLFFSNINVVRNNQNIGADLNIAQCYEFPRTPYVWIFGDDDLILPGSLALILNVLLKERVDMLYLNHYWFKDNFKEKLITKRILRLTSFSDALKFAKRTNVMLSFISGLIIRSGVGQEYRSLLATSNLLQFSWVLPLLRDGNSFAVLENKVLAARGGNSGGYGLVNVFGKNLKKITNSILKDKPEVAKAIQNGTIVKFFPGLIMVFRNGSSRFSDNDMAAGLYDAFGDNWRYYIFIAPLIHMPLYLSRLYYLFVRLFAKLAGSLVI